MTRRTPRRPGRPTKLTPETADRIIRAVRTGNYMETAAAHANVGVTTLYRWLQEAEHPDAPATLREFREAVLRARADAEVRTVALISKAIQGGYVTKKTTRTYRDAGTGELVTEVEETLAPVDGKLGLEFLSRTAPGRFGRIDRSKVEITGDEGGPVQVESTVVAMGLAERVAAAIEARKAEEEEIEDAEVVSDDSWQASA